MQSLINKPLLSSTRLPLDHFISGALLGGMSAFAMNLNNQDKTQIGKHVVKMSLGGGITAATAIAASNSLVKGEYTKSALYVTGGIAGLIFLEKIFKAEE